MGGKQRILSTSSLGLLPVGSVDENNMFRPGFCTSAGKKASVVTSVLKTMVVKALNSTYR